MGLRKPTFEEQVAAPENAADDAATVVDTAAAADAAHAEAKGTPNATTATAVANTGSTAVGKVGRFKPALSQFENQIDASALDFDTFPRVTVGLDGFSDQDEKELGKKIRLQLMSWNYRYVISPGVKNAEADEMVRYSLDGKTIDGTGQLCTEYIKQLVDVEGYTDASLKKYVTLYGFLVATSETGDLKDFDAEDRKIISVQVPPRSVSKFTGFQIEAGVKMSQGVVADTDMLVLTQKKVDGKSTKYAEILFSFK